MFISKRTKAEKLFRKSHLGIETGICVYRRITDHRFEIYTWRMKNNNSNGNGNDEEMDFD